MENKITIFQNEQFGEVRTLIIDNEPWFVGKGIAEVLGYLNSSDALKSHVDEEDKKKIAFYDYPKFGNKGAVLINESGIYSLIFSSKLPSAKEFKGYYDMRQDKEKIKELEGTINSLYFEIHEDYDKFKALEEEYKKLQATNSELENTIDKLNTDYYNYKCKSERNY